MEIKQNLSSRGIAFLALVGLAGLLLGIGSLRDTAALEKQGLTIEAKITETKQDAKGGATTNRVRYSFQPSAGAPEVTRKDFLGRSNLWSTLADEAYRAAVTSGTIQIRYVPTNPGNNAPANALPKTGDGWTLIALGGVMILAAVFAFFRQRKEAAQGGLAETPDNEAIAEVMALPVLDVRAAPGTYFLISLLGLPLIALAVYLFLKGQGQTLYAAIFFAFGVFCFLNVASIRLFFDGRKVLYTSLLKQTMVRMREVTGAKIGTIDTAGSAAFFFLSTQTRGDVMLNLRIFRRDDAQEFCARLAMLGILPEVENGKMSQRLMDELYPQGEDTDEGSDADASGERE